MYTCSVLLLSQCTHSTAANSGNVDSGYLCDGANANANAYPITPIENTHIHFARVQASISECSHGGDAFAINGYAWAYPVAKWSSFIEGNRRSEWKKATMNKRINKNTKSLSMPLFCGICLRLFSRTKQFHLIEGRYHVLPLLGTVCVYVWRICWWVLMWEIVGNLHFSSSFTTIYSVNLLHW